MQLNSQLILLLCIIIPFTSFTQNLTQTIRGSVTDAVTGQALAGATVQIVETGQGMVTDSSGSFRFEKIPVGRYQLKASYLGYQAIVVPEILVESGREVIQNIALSESPAALDSVVVTSARLNLRTSAPNSIHTLTIEETLRFPATFYDPARLATAYAGVVNDNDQANGISVRGNSPNSILWRLEGVDIVNPNHTPNAGTFSDRVTPNGGGVNILSAQMLGTSAFYTGAFPASFGNVLSGVLDMKLRNGNNQQRETIAQIGLIGLDIASEGPFSKNGNASYLFNIRYSTVGLITHLGVDFGDEQINFYDASFNFSFPFKNGAKLTLFGMGGSSENIFEAGRDSSIWEFQKDRYDIRFESDMGALGATFTKPIGKKAFWSNAFAYSILDSRRTGDRLNENYQPQSLDSDQYLQSKWSLHTYLNYKENARSNWQIGFLATLQQYDIRSVQNRIGRTFAKGDNVIVQPYANWRYQIAPKWSANLGLRLLLATEYSSALLEPRASIQWDWSERRSLSLAYGLHGQIEQPQVFKAFVTSDPSGTYDLEFTKAHHFVLGYREKLSRSSLLSMEIYYQSLFDVPVTFPVDGGTSFSALNLLEEPPPLGLVNEGTGTNYGFELSLQKYMLHDFYYLVNITLYDSKYKGSDGIERNTRWNGNYIFNATAGKEWRWAQRKGNIDAVFGANVRVAYIGGFRSTPIDVQASAAAGETIYNSEEAFTIQQKDYFRTDFRFYYKRNKTRYSSTLALDIQNATNAQNEAFSYYDTLQQQIVIKNQLGLIPLLSWRLEF